MPSQLASKQDFSTTALHPLKIGSIPCANEPRIPDNLSQCDVSFNAVFRTREEPAGGIAAPLAEQRIKNS
jgi:hypothetical protein